jgi:hypothetical protein
MIIDDKHQFVFVHIPKCAGTSIRIVLEKFDTTGGAFRNRAAVHPTLGRIDTGHLPLALLQEHYPEALERIRAYHSFAVLRDPFRRFSSSLYQRLAMYGEKPVKQLSVGEMGHALDEAMLFLDRNRRLACLPYDYIHFQNQRSYVELEGRRVIDALYATDSIGKLLKDIGRLVGQDLVDEANRESPHIGKAVMYRSGLAQFIGGAVRPMAGAAHRMLPEPIKDRIRDFMYVPSEQRNREVFDTARVRDFVADYYADDIRLYQSIRSRQPEAVPADAVQ